MTLRTLGVASCLGVALAFAGACSNPQEPAATSVLSCGSQLTFEEMDLIAPADPTVDGASASLYRFLASAEAKNAGLPASGWKPVADTADGVLFIANPPAGEWMMVAMVRRAGAWAPVEWGVCVPRAERQDLMAAVWDLAAEPQATSTEILAVVAAGFCAGDGPLERRLQPPAIEYGTDSIKVTLWATSTAPQSDVSACVGGLFTPFTIALTEPIGTRVLLDGSEFPPRVVEVRTAEVDPGVASSGPPPR